MNFLPPPAANCTNFMLKYCSIYFYCGNMSFLYFIFLLVCFISISSLRINSSTSSDTHFHRTFNTIRLNITKLIFLSGSEKKKEEEKLATSVNFSFLPTMIIISILQIICVVASILRGKFVQNILETLLKAV